MSETLKKALAELQEQKAAIQEKSAPLHAKKEQTLAEYRKAEAALKQVNDEIAAIERPHLYNLDVQIAGIVRMLPNHVKVPEA